jgi:hypothetical protein
MFDKTIQGVADTAPADVKMFLDRPETDDLKFGYRVIVDWLKTTLTNAPRPLRLAVTGPLGAGKSTLIRNALDELEQTSNETIAIAYVDVWKLDKESARRSAILQIAKGFGLHADTINELKKNIYGVTTDVTDEPSNKTFVNPGKALYKVIGVSIVYAILLAFLINTVLGSIFDSPKPSESSKIFLSLLTGLAIAAFSVISNLFVNTFVNIRNSVSRAPLVGAEEFELCLRAILDTVKLANKQAIIVFDNIDRAPSERTQEILTGLAAFFDDSEEKTVRDLIIVVPFAKGIVAGLNETAIQKFFDVVIPLPEIIPQDLTEYTEALISQTKWIDHRKELAEIITLGPYKTPREIKHFINELLSLLNLATQMEQKVITEGNNASGEYLSPGLVTKNVLAYAKVLICEDIWSDFLRTGVNGFWTLEEMFLAEKYRALIEDKVYETCKLQIQKLSEYLAATTGLPAEVPFSPEPFFYLKGADELLKIQGGSEMERALIQRDSKAVEKYIEDSDRNVRVENLRSIFQLTTKKYKGGLQRRKNAIIAVLNALMSQKVSDRPILAILSEEIERATGLIPELSIEQVRFLTPIEGDKVTNENLWRLMDLEFRRSKGPKSDDSEQSDDWNIRYLCDVVKQPGGKQRAQLTSKDFGLPRLMKSEIITALGSDYPSEYSSPETAINAISFYINKSFGFSDVLEVQRANLIVECGLKEAGPEISGQLAGHLNSIWTYLSNNVSNPGSAEISLLGIGAIIDAIPSDQRCPAEHWQTLAKNLNAKQPLPAPQNFSTTGKAGFTVFLLSIHRKVGLPSYGNLNNVLKTLVNSFSKDDILKLIDYTNGWNWFTEIWSIAPTELRNRIINDSEIFEFTMLNSSGDATQTLMNEWNHFKAVPTLGNIVEKASDQGAGISQAAWINIVAQNPTVFSLDIRMLVVKLAGAKTPRPNLSALVDHELTNLESMPTALLLIKWLKAEDPPRLEKMADDCSEYLRMNSPQSWTSREACSLKIVTEMINRISKDASEQIVERAIQRGIRDGTSNDVSTSIADMAAQILEAGKALETLDGLEDSIEKTGKLNAEIKTALSSRISGIRERYNLKKKSFLGSLLGT